MGSTPLNKGGMLSAAEAAERLIAYNKTHPTRYVGILWRGVGRVAVTRTVFAAPAASQSDLEDALRASQESHAYVSLRHFNTNAAAATRWLNAKEEDPVE